MPPRSRIVGVPAASSDGRFYGRYPAGDRPAGAAALAGNAAVLVGSSAALVAAGPTSVPNLLYDNFESGNMQVGNTLSVALNTVGFQWEVNNRVAVVTMIGGLPMKVYENAVLTPVYDAAANAGKDWTAKNGTKCIRFRHPANDVMSEQRWSMTTHVPDLWCRYWIRVAVNFYHNPAGTNNKWSAWWTNAYDGTGDVTFQTRPQVGNDGGASLVVQDGGVAVVEVGVINDFISVPRDLGRWMEVAYRLKPASASGANDGIIQVWRRWSDEPTFTQIYNKTNARFYEGGQGIYQGYLMGAENAMYAVETEFLLDDFSLSSASLVT